MSRPPSQHASAIEAWLQDEADHRTSAADLLQWLVSEVPTGAKNKVIMRQMGWSDAAMTVHQYGAVWSCDTCDGQAYADRLKDYRVEDRWLTLCPGCQDGKTPMAADIVERADEVKPFNA